MKLFLSKIIPTQIFDPFDKFSNDLLDLISTVRIEYEMVVDNQFSIVVNIVI